MARMKAGAAGEGMRRSISRWELTGLAINGIVGAGIFGLPSRAYALLGVWSLLAFAVCAFLAGFVALCFAEVGSRFRQTGGPYLYGREALGAETGFLVSWLWWLSRAAAFAANLNLLLDYVGLFWPALQQPALHATSIIAITLLLLVLNLSGVRDSTNASTFLTCAKLLVLVLFVLVGLFHLDGSRLSFASASFSADHLATAVLLLIYAFTGFEMVTVPGGELRDPQHDLPRALLSAMMVVAVLYIALQIVCIGTLPGLGVSTRPLADAAQHFAGRPGAVFLVTGAIVSILGNLNLLLLASSWIPFAMACSGDLPAWLGKVHPKTQTPYWAIVATGAAMLGLSLWRSFLAALTISSACRLLAYAATAVALLKLRSKANAPVAAFQMPWAAILVPFTLLLIAWLLLHVTRVEALQTAGLTAFGLALFFLTGRERKRRQVQL